MKRMNPLKNKIVQFGYDHQNFDRQLKRMHSSAKEVEKMLDNMSPKPEKEKEQKEN